MPHAISTLVISAGTSEPPTITHHPLATVPHPWRETRDWGQDLVGSHLAWLAKHADMSIKALKWTARGRESQDTQIQTPFPGAANYFSSTGDENCQLYAFPLRPRSWPPSPSVFFLYVLGETWRPLAVFPLNYRVGTHMPDAQLGCMRHDAGVCG